MKRPLAPGFSRLTGAAPAVSQLSPWWLLLFLFLLAPVTEEAIKLLPFAFSGWRRELKNRGAAVWAGSFAGLGFGIGEVWFLAWSVAQVPAYAGLRFWEFGGFFGERLLATYAHAVLTAVAVSGLAAGGRRGIYGYLSAVGLHSLLNLIVLTVCFQRLVSAARRQSPPSETTLYERESNDGLPPQSEPPAEHRDPV